MNDPRDPYRRRIGGRWYWDQGVVICLIAYAFLVTVLATVFANEADGHLLTIQELRSNATTQEARQ